MKKSLIKKLICAALCVLLVFSLASSSLAASRCCEKRSVLAVAHRGFSSAAPENTLAAFRLAGERGYYGCEFDIHPTKDGVWVVNHDDTVDRMTDGSGRIDSLTYAELSAFKIDAGNNLDAYPNEAIPTLAEALDVCDEYSLRPIIEVKGGKSEDMPGLAAFLSARSFPNGYTLISFEWEYLEPLRKELPDAEMWMLTNEILPSHLKFCKEHRIDGISFNYTNNIALSILLVKACGLKTVSWTVDNKTAARRLFALGVGAVTTNALLPQDLEMEGVTLCEIFTDAFHDAAAAIKAFFAK